MERERGEDWRGSLRRQKQRETERKGDVVTRVVERDGESQVAEGRSGVCKVTHRVVGRRKWSIGSAGRFEQIFRHRS